jgi:hypothetical protein
VRGLGRDLKAVADLDRLRRLTFDREFELAFRDVGGLDAGVSVPGDNSAGVDINGDEKCDVLAIGQFRLLQDRALEAGPCLRALGLGLGRGKTDRDTECACASFATAWRFPPFLR